MKAAIMQPYVFPYLGYYQLVNAVDLFVFFDDVNFIKKGWINRNNILVNGEANKFTIPVKEISQNSLINQVELFEFEKWADKFLKTLAVSYKKAPKFRETFSLIEEVFNQPNSGVAKLAENSIISVFKYLGCEINYKRSSELVYKRTDTTGEDKIIEICKIVGATEYLNPYNGRELYKADSFEKCAISLGFLRMDEISYAQFMKENFVPSLSMIDVLMFNEKEAVRELLGKYKIIG